MKVMPTGMVPVLQVPPFHEFVQNVYITYFVLIKQNLKIILKVQEIESII